MKFAESHRSIFSSLRVSTVLDTSMVAAKQLDFTPPTGEYLRAPLRDKVEGVDYFLPKFDLRNGKRSLPISKPTERKPPQDFMFYPSTIGRLEVILNENNSDVYADIHMQKRDVFENYFKAGNYLLARDKEASARFKYYELIVSH